MQHWQLAFAFIGCGLAVAAITLVWPRRRDTSASVGTESVAAPVPEHKRPPRTPSASEPADAEPPGETQAVQQETRAEVLRKLQALAFGAAMARAVDLSGAQGEIAANIRAALTGIADKPNYAPRRPMLLPKLMQAMHDDEVSRRELARIIGTDPALAGALLRLANSPFYRIRPEPVESLDRAIALLGLEGMRSLVAAALLQPVFRSSGRMFAQFGEVTWEHTVYSAQAAEAHSAVLENSDPFAAQLLSLLMGLATMVLFRVATDEYLAHRLQPNITLIAALIDSEGPALARQIAASWQLSERIDTALAEQGGDGSAAHSALGRSLQTGRLLGALVVLHLRHVMDEDAVKAVLLQTAGPAAAAHERIWNRLRAARA
jgi:HD-like signal output (HDOD) protein